MKITMDGKWAQRKSPTEQVRVLCVDAEFDNYPVIYLAQGAPWSCSADGQPLLNNESEHECDLVPWREAHPLDEVEPRTPVLVWDGDVSHAVLRRFIALTHGAIECEPRPGGDRHEWWKRGLTVENYAEKYL